MDKIKILISAIFFLAVETILACPSCIGSMDDPKSGNLVYILSGFIVLTYIPFYFIYKTIIKNRNFNETIEDGKSE